MDHKRITRLVKSFVLAEACVSRTHRQHRRCRPPVLKTGTITGPHALPYRVWSRSSMPGVWSTCDHPGVLGRAQRTALPHAQFLKNNACFAMGSVRPVRAAIWVVLSGVKSRASCTFSSSCAIESHPMITVLTGKLRVK